MACMAYRIGANIRACALRSPSRGGSKLSIAWIRGPFLGPDGSASLAGFNSRLVSTKKNFPSCLHCAPWVISVGMIGCLPWPICLHDIPNKEKFIRGGTVQKTRRKLPIADHVYTLAGRSC